MICLKTSYKISLRIFVYFLTLNMNGSNVQSAFFNAFNHEYSYR
ncbi:hypothetical protein MTBPR1_30094 [Candidatus Terasakiella magnetica]|uniref:Uncharacterized protein n=1 Tax=Candidatus Terasakiella magnetica TaxID=1867952 RepID=A0A1C3RHN7_9PROT|nr:hypothetical protein MTBPR1_30094 [Candidatus Terasakiella magnetica]